MNSSCDHVLCSSIDSVYKRNRYHLHIWIPHAFLFICECLKFFFFNLLYKNRLPSLGWGGKSWHKIIWCVYIWVSKYNSYHTYLSLSHLSFILCTVVTITTSMRKAGFLTPKCPWVFLCSRAVINEIHLTHWVVSFCSAIFSLQVKLVIIRSW